MMKKNNEVAAKVTMDDFYEKLGEIVERVKGMNATVDSLNRDNLAIRADLDETRNELAELKLMEEITTEQVEQIKQAARSRVNGLIGSSDEARAKYFIPFIISCYNDAKREAGLGTKISVTKKRDYEKAMDYIKMWRPDGGSVKFKKHVDAMAAGRKA